ncbi:MAG: tripartite tricarboxylate transporter substrate binding protein [Burkholderiales bacterium]|jgi:tripartite-type tricarboxylate transporter receptor subunit TctC|nr:tripartite tricarboxylate transporter substrate binding protein [Burkholderiales bacterium]
MGKTKMPLLGLAGCATALMLLTGAVQAQKYPERPVRLVVPYPSGASSNDILARQIAPKLTERLGHNVVVDNRSGASGNIGAELVARSPADGHTLLYGTGGLFSIGPHLYKKLAYSPDRDLAPVALVAVVPYMLVINASLPVKNLAEFIAYAKSRPGKLSFASSGVGGTPHLCIEMLKMMAGIDLLHVPYKGGAPAVVDTIAGQTQAYCAGLAATMPHVNSGKLRALGVTTLKRSSGAPDMPTLDEQGLKGFDVNSWGAIFVPAKTPKHAVQKLHSTLAAVMETDDMRNTLIKQGMDPLFLGPQQLADLIRTESANWAKVIKTAGIKLE